MGNAENRARLNAGSRMTTELTLVTPDMACRWLEQNTNNRRVSNARVQKFARDMREGNWASNGETIKFATDGRLVDGQHRLWAIFEAQVPVEVLVVRGLDFDEAMPTVDTGKARSYHDVLTIRDRGNAAMALLSPVARMWHRYLYGGAAFSDLSPSHSELDAVVERVPTIIDAIEAVRSYSVTRTMQPSILAFVYSAAVQVYPAEAQVWLQRAATGVDLKDRDPIMLLRRRYEEEAAKKGTKLSQVARVALAVKSWNQFIRADGKQVLAWKASQEGFPRFHELDQFVEPVKAAPKRARGTLEATPSVPVRRAKAAASRKTVRR